MIEHITRLMANRQICMLLLIVWATMSISTSAYTMPADKLVAMSNKQLCAKGQTHWDKNELDSALICFNIVANRADTKQSKEELACVCEALTVMAKIYNSRYYDFERATLSLLKSEQIALTNHFDLRLAETYEQMAILETKKNDMQKDFAFSPKAYELHRKAFHYSLINGNDLQRVAIIAIINLATLALGNNKFDEIQNELTLFQSLTIKDTIPSYVVAQHQSAAAIYVYHHQYDSALNEFSKLKLYLDTQDQTWLTNLYKTIAHQSSFFIYRDTNDQAAALHELDMVEHIAREYDMKEIVIEALFLKQDYYAALGNTAMADKFDLQYHKAKDQFMAEAKVAKADEEKVLFKLNEANHEIKELSYQQRIQQTELIAVALVAILLLALLVLAWLSHQRTKEKNRSLYLQNQQLLANIDRVRQLRQEQAAPTEKYGRGKMEDDDIAQVMLKVEHVMDESEDIYSAGFSLDRLAELAGETESRVSQAINTSGRKFYELLNEYRVREACRRMDDKTHSSGLTIEAIGQSVGFKSRSNFVATFKRLTGLTPSAYFKQPSKTEEQSKSNNQDIST